MLTKRLADVTGVRQVTRTDLHLVGEPYCRVLELLDRPELRRSDDQSQTIAAIAQPAQSGVLTLKAGMPLALQLTGPDYPSYVYVDYFTADGRVYHLLPTASLSDHRLRPNERLTIGGQNGRGVKATIGPPFGLDLVVALASDVPLWAQARPVAESADAYLAGLAAATVAEEHRARADPADRVLVLPDPNDGRMTGPPTPMSPSGSAISVRFSPLRPDFLLLDSGPGVSPSSPRTPLCTSAIVLRPPGPWKIDGLALAGRGRSALASASGLSSTPSMKS